MAVENPEGAAQEVTHPPIQGRILGALVAHAILHDAPEVRGGLETTRMVRLGILRLCSLGMEVESPTPLLCGSALEIRIYAGERELIRRTLGRVVWTCDLDARKGAQRAGIAFLDFEPGP